jgi:hypothetical protein
MRMHYSTFRQHLNPIMQIDVSFHKLINRFKKFGSCRTLQIDATIVFRLVLPGRRSNHSHLCIQCSRSNFERWWQTRVVATKKKSKQTKVLINKEFKHQKFLRLNTELKVEFTIIHPSELVNIQRISARRVYGRERCEKFKHITIYKTNTE